MKIDNSNTKSSQVQQQQQQIQQPQQRQQQQQQQPQIQQQQQQIQQQQQQQEIGLVSYEDIDSLLKDIKTLLEKMYSILDSIHDRVLKILNLTIEKKTLKTFLKQLTKNYYFEFMPGKTLGDLLKGKISDKDIPLISKELNIDIQTFYDILEDKIFPDKPLSEKLLYILKTKYGVKPDDFYICKAHTYTKIKILQDKSINLEKIKKKIEEKKNEKK